MPATLNLTHEPETIDFPATQYVFIERIGNIPSNAPKPGKLSKNLRPH